MLRIVTSPTLDDASPVPPTSTELETPTYPRSGFRIFER